jgi:hypothetical protein
MFLLCTRLGRALCEAASSWRAWTGAQPCMHPFCITRGPAQGTRCTGGRRAAGASALTACSAGAGALEAEWRRECLAFARVRKLAHVEEMRVLYLVRRPQP